jgi:hypothetical protein
MKITYRLLAVFSLSVTALLSGCGGSSSNPGGSTQQSPPTVTSISPTTVTAGSGAVSLTVNGSGFLSTTTVQVGSVAEATTYVSATQLTATVPAAQVAAGGQLSVIALNGSASSGSGAATSLQVTNPVPVIAQITPTTLSVGTASVTIAVSGSGFVPTTTIDVNGSARTTVFVSATQVNATLTAADVASTGSLSLTAVNPAPGGGTSAAVTAAISNPAPGAVLALSPTQFVTGTATPTTVTVTGTNFIPASTVQVSGAARATTYVSATQLTFQLTVADQAMTQVLAVTVVNPAPGGGTTLAAQLEILPQMATPVITSVSPSQLVVGSGTTWLTVYGTNLFATIATGPNSGMYILTSNVLWNGTSLTKGVSVGYGSSNGGQEYITAPVPSSLLTTAGTAIITVSDSTSTPPTSNALTVTIANPPPPTLTMIYPSGGAINTATPVTLYGTGFTASSTVALNGVNIPANYVSASELTVVIPAASEALPGNLSLTVTTPAPGGGTTAPLLYTAYIGITNNDMVSNPADGLLYVSVPGSATGGLGNSIVAIDPATGNIVRQIPVGSNPNKLALSSDGTQLFVGIDGATAVAQVSLASGQVVNQFSLGGGTGVYNPAYTATALAVLPGLPNSVAVQASSGIVTIYDAGVARADNSSGLTDTYFDENYGSLSFGSSASILYANSSPFQGIQEFTVGAAGITAATNLSSSVVGNNIQYDKGRLYLSNGAVLDAASGALLGTFYASANSPDSGPVVSDSTLGLAFIASGGTSNSGSQVLAFNEASFLPSGSLLFNGSNGYFNKIVRWGQNGLAVNGPTQIFLFQSPLVKDLSASPADLSVVLGAPATATTGTAFSTVATVKNLGPNQALDAVSVLNLDASLIVNSITPSQGSCQAVSAITCDLGNLANGSSATVTVSVTPTSSGTLAETANVTSESYDPTSTNNQQTTSTTVTGSLYAAVPSVSSISPAIVQAGSGAFTLTVTGSGFNADSVVNLNGSALPTTFVSATQLTANLPGTAIANYGWASVTVSNPSPGGGISTVAPLTIYAVVSVPANAILLDPFSQQVYASVPSAATSVTGNSIVAINPYTAAVGTPIAIGSEPNVMAETSDGNYLYVGLSGADSLAQFDLVQQKVKATIPLAYTQYGTTTSASATSLAAMPGSDTSLAIGISDGWGNFGIFDVNGNSGSFRPNFSGYYEGVNPVFASAAELYAYDSQTTGAEFYRYSVNANGLSLIDGSTLYGMGGFSGGFQLANGMVYGGAGGVVNPLTTPPTQIATMSLPDFYQSGISPEGVGAVPDASTQKEFLMLENTAGTWEYALARYDLTRYLPETWVSMPASASGILSGWTMYRWGQDGLVLLSSAESYGGGVTEILLMRGPFVTPQLLQTNSAASLSASSSSTLTHGAGNTMLTLTGSNFLPGVAVTWNGSYRTTTIVDATHLTVAIPASDLASAGSASLLATNPGAAASNALTITIQ